VCRCLLKYNIFLGFFIQLKQQSDYNQYYVKMDASVVHQHGAAWLPEPPFAMPRVAAAKKKLGWCLLSHKAAARYS